MLDQDDLDLVPHRLMTVLRDTPDASATAVLPHRPNSLAIAPATRPALHLASPPNVWADGIRHQLRVRTFLAQAESALGLSDPDTTIRCAAIAETLDPYRGRAVQVLIKVGSASATGPALPCL
jgi:hypothetical protein